MYVPKATKYTQATDGSGPETSLPAMKCVRDGCENMLLPGQVYEFLRGKTRGNCSRKCGSASYPGRNYATGSYVVNEPKACVVCGKMFIAAESNMTKRRVVCSMACAGKRSSKRMSQSNPMTEMGAREKMITMLRKIGHKPYVQGGNGRGATKPQVDLYNALCALDDSFEMEVIEKTGAYRKVYKTPNHYKIDIASRRLKVAIEVDGVSHGSKKVQECDERKSTVLALRGWKVWRFTNSQIEMQLSDCVQMVLSTTSP